MSILRSSPSQQRTGVLLVNLGTPAQPTPFALRRYLREFLSDRRVVELPPGLWRPLLEGFILPLRAPRSAALYRSIWMPEGSPLRVYTEQLGRALGAYFDSRGNFPAVKVDVGMRYGHPSIAYALDRLEDCSPLVVLPLYPQYSVATTASSFDGLARALERRRHIPELIFVRGYHAEAEYVAAVADRIRRDWSERGGMPDHLLISFHGLPRRSVADGDPYYAQCLETSEWLATQLALHAGQWSLSFQSRFGPTPWLPPYTIDRVRELARAGVRRLDVVCPGFACDCLETLEEIAVRNAQAFVEAGGHAFHYIPALNADAGHVQALARILARHIT
ncbi:MAG: ferrochelatase [Gammaproteobacteria bacterium]